MKTMQILNFPISIGKYQDYIEYIMNSASNGRSQYIYVANVHMVVEAFWNKSFSEKVRHAGLVTPDGKPLTWALRLLHGIKQDRVAGMDILPALLKQSETNQTPVYIYGGTENLLNRTQNYLDRHYPNLHIKGLYSPPFRALTPEEEERTIERINTSGAKLLFVVLGCPKQEQWMASMAGRINAVMIGIAQEDDLVGTLFQGAHVFLHPLHHPFLQAMGLGRLGGRQGGQNIAVRQAVEPAGMVQPLGEPGDYEARRRLGRGAGGPAHHLGYADGWDQALLRIGHRRVGAEADERVGGAGRHGAGGEGKGRQAGGGEQGLTCHEDLLWRYKHSFATSVAS